tara:strand:+ start:745 stop:1650 length:906 start_codon:yes stop_codon:yes gene_type:complete
MAFKLKSGNTTSFKLMGGTDKSPAKHRLTRRVPNKVDFDRLPKSYPRDHAVEIKHDHPKDEKKGDSIKTEHGVVVSDKKPSPAKDMKTGSYKQSFESSSKKSPAYQKVNKEGEAQDQDKIFDAKGNHIGNWVNDKKVMFNDKPAVDQNLRRDKLVKKMEKKNLKTLKKSPAKQTKDTFADGSKKSARDKFNDKETAAEIKKNGGRDNQKRKSIVGEKTSGFGPVAQKNNLTPKQNAVSRAEMSGLDSKSPYWYKVNGKTVSKNQYLNYENKPGGDEPGKQTNHPDVYGRIKNNHGRGPKTK